jgi:ketosteroid isomerase-like protein
MSEPLPTTRIGRTSSTVSTVSDLAIAADDNLGYGHSIQHVTGKNKKGEPIDLTVRVSRGYRKVDGHWLVAMDHVSVPVDLDTGKPDLQSKP